MPAQVKKSAAWTLIITGVALFMTALDNLIVGVALPTIRADLGGSIEALEWTVNAYTLTFAVLLITGAALGIWGGISGLGVALGPLVGGAVIEGISWHWIFWVNVPVGLVLIPLAYRYLEESTGPDKALDLPGLGLVGAGLFGLTFGIIRGEAIGWPSLPIVASIGLGLVFLADFVAWELIAKEPMLPMRFFKSRAFSATNGLSFSMFFGIFGAIFLLSQFFQTAQGYGPLKAGLMTLPWTVMPMFVAPVAGALSDRIGTRPLMFTGLSLQAAGLGWIALISSPDVPFSQLLVPFMMAGAGMALVFPTAAAAVMSSVGERETGKASGSTNAIREIGGVMGVAVLSSVFAANGGFNSPQAFNDGMVAALPIAVVVLVIGAGLALLVPGKPKAEPAGKLEDVPEAAAKSARSELDPAPQAG